MLILSSYSDINFFALSTVVFQAKCRIGIGTLVSEYTLIISDISRCDCKLWLHIKCTYIYNLVIQWICNYFWNNYSLSWFALRTLTKHSALKSLWTTDKTLWKGYTIYFRCIMKHWSLFIHWKCHPQVRTVKRDIMEFEYRLRLWFFFKICLVRWIKKNCMKSFHYKNDIVMIIHATDMAI